MRTQPIVEAEIRKAIASFLSRGGMMQHLPDEKTPILNLVGRKWGQFEDLFASDLAGPEQF